MNGALAPSRLVALSLAECRGAGRRLVFFVACLALGVAAVTSVQSFSVLLQNSVQRESKALLAADIEISGSWEQSTRDREIQTSLLPPGTELLYLKELHAMARAAPPARAEAHRHPASLLVELKAVPDTPPLYPLYGHLKTRPAQPLAQSIASRSAIVEPGFLSRTGLDIGDSFELGKISVRITAIIEGEPDRISRAFSLGPRVMISLDTLNDAGLIQPGSRIRHRTLIRLPEGSDPDAETQRLEQHLTDKGLSIRTHKSMESSITHSIERMGQYLGAVAAIALLLGGVGVAMVVRTFMAQKTGTLAILNCLGARPRTVFSIYLLQSLALGAVGSVAGVVLALAVQTVLPGLLPGLLNVEVQARMDPAAILQGLLLGLATTLLFSLWPLLRAVKTRPLLLLRNLAEESGLSSRKERWLAGAMLGAGLAATLFWQTGSLRRGAVFLSAIAVSILALMGVSALALRLLRTAPAPPNLALRYGLANLHRPNSQALSIITAVGMGVMLVLGVRLIQADMIALLRENTEQQPPNFFFIDIQREQKETFERVMSEAAPDAGWELVPLIRSRLYAADDRRADQWRYVNRHDEEWFIQREFVLTTGGSAPPEGNTVIGGNWWTPREADAPQVSVEEDAAKRLGVKIGSSLTVDIQGVLVTAPVTSIRRVNWRNMRTNFYMIFSPGALRDAPITYVGTVRVDRDRELPLQQAVVAALPNITAIGTRDIADTVAAVTGKLMALVDFMSAFTVACGLFILTGAVAATKFRRMREAAILKTLGATRGTVAAMLGQEYAVLGLLAGTVGALLALLLSWAVMHFLIEAPWHFRWHPVAATVVLASLATTLAGIACNLDVLNNKPLQTLRAQES